MKTINKPKRMNPSKVVVLGIVSLSAATVGSLMWLLDAFVFSHLLYTRAENLLLFSGLFLILLGLITGLLGKSDLKGKIGIALALISPLWIILGWLAAPTGPGAHHN